MKEIQVSEEALSRLESSLNQIRFKGIPIGGLTASALYIELYLGNSDWSLKARVRDILSRVKMLLPKIQSSKVQGGQYLQGSTATNKALITFSSSRRHIFNMSYVFWKNLNEDSICFLLDKGVRMQFSDNDQPITILSSDVLPCSLVEWRREFRKIGKQIAKELKVFTRVNRIPRFVAFRITNYMIGQTQKLLAYEAFLQQIKPRYLLVEYDRFHIASPLVLAGRLAQTPTFTMVHGAINNKIGYFPVLSDRLFCWGKGQKEQLQNFLKSEEHSLSNVEVIGAPQIADSLSVSKAQARGKFQIPAHKKVVLLATNSMRMELRHRLIELFCLALQGYDDIQGIVRIHPSEEPGFYSEYIKRYPNLHIDVEYSLTYEESLAIADIVCIFNSAFGLDALLKHIPLVVVNIETKELGQSRDLINSGKMPVVDTSSALIDTIKQYFQNEAYRMALDSNVSAYAEHYCAAFGTDAATKMNTAIESFISSRSQ
jgi:hypothetical protein